MKTLKTITCLAALLTGFSILPTKASVLFEGSTWYASGTAASLTADSGNMSMAIGSGSFALTYVTASGSPLTLNVGDTLTYTVTFSIDSPIGASASGLRFGLFNSNGSRINADNLGQSNATYANYTGYSSAFGSNSASSNSLTSSLWERSNSNNSLINVSGAFNTAPGTGSTGSTNTSTTPAMAADTNYTMKLTLNYVSAGNIQVSSLLTGGALPGGGISRSYTDATPYTSFDTVVLFSTSSMSTSMTFDSMNITVVPEPSVAGLLLGAVGLFLIVRKSRRMFGVEGPA